MNALFLIAFLCVFFLAVSWISDRCERVGERIAQRREHHDG